MARLRRPLVLGLWAAGFLLYAAYFQGQWVYGERPIYHITGDEPHYLTIATSIARDGDLDVLNNYRDKHYFGYYPFHLGDPRDPEDMHAIYGRGGALYSKHGLGLPLLLLPALASGGHGPAIVFMLACSALLAVQLFLLSREAFLSREAAGQAAPAAWAGLAVAFSPPLLLFAHQFYPEVPGALLVVVGLRAAFALFGQAERRPGSWGPLGAAVALGSVIGLLPWFHLRYIPLAAALAVVAGVALWPHRRDRAAVAAAVAPVLVSAAGLLLLNWRLFGGVPPVEEYGTLAPSHLVRGLPGLLLDRQFGLLPYAPVYLLALYGIAALPAGIGRRRAGALLGVAGTYTLFVGAFSYWYGAFSPPARMLVPVVPLLAVPLAAGLARWRTRRYRGLFAGLVLVTWSIAHLLMDVPRLRFDLPDGKSATLAYLSAVWGVDVTGALPSFLVPSPASYLWAAGAVAVAAAAWLAATRPLDLPRREVAGPSPARPTWTGAR